MDKIELVDLKNQYLEIEEDINQAVLDVIRSGAYINGPEVKAFQSELESYLSVKHVIPCANGTDALQIALMALGLKPGDEVITPSFTYIATAEVIALLNLKAVFVEVDPDTFTIDPDSLKKAITSKTKAIIPVHLYGVCAHMEEILKIANEHEIAIVEDTAQAIGSEYTFADGTVKKAGTIGTIGTTSFFPSKNLGCFGDGGAIFTNDDELANVLRMVANHGQSKKYIHDIIGCNSRLDSIQAAILRVKLRKLDQYLAARNSAADFYSENFAHLDEVQTPVVPEYSNHGYHQYTLKLNGVSRDELQKHLAKHGIPSNIYYPIPIHKQKGFEGRFRTPGLALTEQLCEEVISLPMHTEFNEEQLTYITDHFISFFKS